MGRLDVIRVGGVLFRRVNESRPDEKTIVFLRPGAHILVCLPVILLTRWRAICCYSASSAAARAGILAARRGAGCTSSWFVTFPIPLPIEVR